MSVPHSGFRNGLMLSVPTAITPFEVTVTAFRLAGGWPVPALAAVAPVTAIVAAAEMAPAAVSNRRWCSRIADSSPCSDQSLDLGSLAMVVVVKVLPEAPERVPRAPRRYGRATPRVNRETHTVWAAPPGLDGGQASQACVSCWHAGGHLRPGCRVARTRRVPGRPVVGPGRGSARRDRRGREDHAAAGGGGASRRPGIYGAADDARAQ